MTVDPSIYIRPEHGLSLISPPKKHESSISFKFLKMMKAAGSIPQVHIATGVLSWLTAITWGDYILAIEDTRLHLLLTAFNRRTLKSHLEKHYAMTTDEKSK